MTGRARMTRDEAGATLVLVVAFLTLTGLFSAALLTLASTTTHSSVTVKALHDSVSAADAGVRYGVDVLQGDSTICASAASGPVQLSGVPQVAQRTVQVKCQTYQGYAPGAFGWAVITNDTSTSAMTNQSGQDKTITGPVFNNGGWTLQKPLNVVNGSVHMVDRGSGCVFDPNITVAGTAPFVEVCDPAGTSVPNPDHALPSSVPGAPLHPPTTHGNCTTLYPGAYTAAPDLSGDVYMVSGVYYFNNVGDLQVGSTLFGGQRSPGDSASTTGTACASDPTGNWGTGVELIFGGNTTLTVGNNSDLELYTREPPAGSTDNGATPGISLYQVPPATTGGWAPSSLSNATNFLSMGNGTHVQGAVHGAVYAPRGSISVFATNDAHAVLNGGTDVWDLNMQSSASATGLIVAIDLTPGQRYTVITATAKGVNGEKDIISRAVVRIANDPNRTATVQSWHTCTANSAGPSDQCGLA